MFVSKHAKAFLLAAIGIIALSGVLLAVFGFNLGIDFTGGSLVEVSYEERPERESVESNIREIGLEGFSLRETVDEAGRDGYILRTKNLTEEERQALEGVLLSEGTGTSVGRFTSIGPTIGEELKRKAVWAIGLVALIIVLYVAFVFRGVSRPVRSWMYGLITILVLFHDVLVPTALFSVLGAWIGAEIDVLFVMAILAVLGYSVNDTIVVFDRVRENLAKNQETNRHEPFTDTVGRSLQETYARSINTSLTTLIVLVVLYFVGGDVTQNFALVLVVGVIAGTYSSLAIATPLLIAIESWQKSKKKET